MAETTGTDWSQIKAATIHGTQGKGQASDGTGTSGNLPKFNADGSLTDSGIAASSTSPIVIGFVINDGSAGTDIGPELLAPRGGSVSVCKVRVKAADGSTALTFRIKQNGTSIFTSDRTISAGTTGTVTITALTASPPPLAVAQDDVFTIDITSGSASWIFVVQLET